jgi:hypothetical protein
LAMKQQELQYTGTERYVRSPKPSDDARWLDLGASYERFRRWRNWANSLRLRSE